MRLLMVVLTAWLARAADPNVQPAVSPAGDRIAYSEPGLVVILNREGRRLRAIPNESCSSVARVGWVTAVRVGVECHMNPSLSQYGEFDVRTGAPVGAILTGYGFTPSPDGKRIAHVGPVIHFAPPYAKSNFLLINDVVVYPLPAGMKPFVPNPSRDFVGVVRQSGSLYTGIHAIAPRFSWSPDSRRVAFFDCTFDWLETGQDAGAGSIGGAQNKRCAIVVAAPDGRVSTFPEEADRFDPDHDRLSWNGNHELHLASATRRSFRIP